MGGGVPVGRIERIVDHVVLQKAERAKRGEHAGKYVCDPPGTNDRGIPFETLDEVAAYLRAHPRAGVRMYPGRSKISENIYIDGVPL